MSTATSFTAICDRCGALNIIDYTKNSIQPVENKILTDKICDDCKENMVYIVSSVDPKVIEEKKEEKEISEHPIFGTDTPDSIRADVNRICDEIKIDPGKIKGSIVNIGTKIIAGIASIPDEDINNVVTGYKNLTKQYAEVVIAFMPLIDKAYKIAEEIKKDLAK